MPGMKYSETFFRDKIVVGKHNLNMHGYIEYLLEVLLFLERYTNDT
jgi:hypothetical protein